MNYMFWMHFEQVDSIRNCVFSIVYLFLYSIACNSSWVRGSTNISADFLLYRFRVESFTTTSQFECARNSTLSEKFLSIRTNHTTYTHLQTFSSYPPVIDELTNWPADASAVDLWPDHSGSQCVSLMEQSTWSAFAHVWGGFYKVITVETWGIWVWLQHDLSAHQVLISTEQVSCASNVRINYHAYAHFWWYIFLSYCTVNIATTLLSICLKVLIMFFYSPPFAFV